MSCKSLLSRLTIVRNLSFLKYGSAINSSTNLLANTTPVISHKYQTNFAKQYSSNANTIPIVSYEEIKQLPKQPKKLLIDVREPKELQETGQIPTSINIPLGKVAAELAPNVDAGAFKAKYGRDLPQKDTEIIFHCKIGKRSLSAAEIAKSLGYTNTKNYLGSWTEWAEKEGLPK
ncbi:rhodanese domain-containing protein CG4456 [Stomoxys calcitrans]|uniref:Rhodanese domain-containing protein n=1 Tax=Stomoxys calcitrans TaxID=35570 RepID=A0A1I8PHC2_STOCA|nr:rhodanese domain-containing protein CG4456 [Stomoxys calcitrans]